MRKRELVGFVRKSKNADAEMTVYIESIICDKELEKAITESAGV
jgi:hypothetical protein